MFYALVSLGVIENTQSKYQYLSKFTGKLRKNGGLSIDSFADRSRSIEDINDIYETSEEYIERAINHLQNAPDEYVNAIPRWHGQEHYVEIGLKKTL
jgi:hypothetical protein